MLVCTIGTFHGKRDTSIMQEDGSWVKGPDLPLSAGIMGHCLCPRTIGENEQYIVAGGYTSWNLVGLLKRVMMYDFHSDAWTSLPNLPEERAYGTCSPYTKTNGDQLILYIGEILDRHQKVSMSSSNKLKSHINLSE